MSEQQKTVNILVYSSDSSTRESVMNVVGNRLDASTHIEWKEVATPPIVITEIESTDYDLVIFDGESHKAGGMALSRQIKNEIFNSPPVVLLIARKQDEWLASWSEAETVVPMPLDPFTFPQLVADTIKNDPRLS